LRFVIFVPLEFVSGFKEEDRKPRPKDDKRRFDNMPKLATKQGLGFKISDRERRPGQGRVAVLVPAPAGRTALSGVPPREVVDAPT
jgi:hypothetical protein